MSVFVWCAVLYSSMVLCDFDILVLYVYYSCLFNWLLCASPSRVFLLSMV